MRTLRILSLLLIVVFAGCRKYDEGPKISLRNPEKTLVNNRWKLTRSEINGASSPVFDGLVWTFTEHSMKMTTNTATFNYYAWELSKSNTWLRGEFDGGADLFIIKRLTNKELFVEYDYPSGEHLRMELKAQ